MNICNLEDLNMFLFYNIEKFIFLKEEVNIVHKPDENEDVPIAVKRNSVVKSNFFGHIRHSLSARRSLFGKHIINSLLGLKKNSI